METPLEREDFQMRRKDRELTNLAEIEEILKKAFVCHLGLTDGFMPYVVPMNYGYEEGHIYLHGAAKGKKIDLIKKNNQVCFEMETFDSKIIKEAEEPCDWGTVFRSVIGFGTATILEDKDEKTKALNVILKPHDGRTFSFPDKMLEATAVIDITITEMTGKHAND